MKSKTLPYISGLLWQLLLLAGLLASCKKSESDYTKDSGKSPRINGIRAIAPAPNNFALQEAFLGQTIVLRGEGFESLRKLYFNGFDTYFNPALFSDTTAVVTIPAAMPLSDLVTSLNTIRIVNSKGEFTYEFPIKPNNPVITSGSLENTPGGVSVTFKGSNLFMIDGFYFIDSIVFPNGNKVVESAITGNPDGTEVTLTVPSGGLQRGDSLRIYTNHGNGTSMFRFNNWLSPTVGYIANFDAVGGSGQWNPPSDAENPNYGWSQQQWVGEWVPDPSATYPNATGTCVAIHPAANVTPGDDSWWQDNRCIITNTVPSWAANMNDAIINYALKFEVYVKDNWTAGNLWIAPGWANWSFIAEYSPWKKTGSYRSTGWETVSIPLSEFRKAKSNRYDKGGDPPANMNELMNANGSGGMLMFRLTTADGFNSAGNEVATGPIAPGSLRIAIDNIRIEKIK